MASDDDKGHLVPKRRNEKSLSQLYCDGDLTYVKDIASGGMSKVSLYILDKDGYQAHVAVKTLFRKIIPERDLKHLRTEVNILTNIDHENIIRTYGIAEMECDFGLVLEYFPKGCYTDYFREFREVAHKTEVAEEIVSPLKLRIIKEIINAMEYLHMPRKLPLSAKEKSTLHLDLKGENVLLDDRLHVKICDFGLSMMATLTRLRTGTTVHRGASGTPGFIAPERLKNFNCKPSTKCDVYSFGILQYTILTDLPPYPDHVVQDIKLLEHYVAEKELRPDVSKVSKVFPLDLIDLMKRCWSAEPDCRPSFQELTRRHSALLGQISDFEREATHAANQVISIISERYRPVHSYDEAPNIETLPDLVSFATTNTGTVTPSDSMETPQGSNQIKSPVVETSEVGFHLHSASQERLDRVRSVGSHQVMSRSSELSSQQHPSTTRKKTPISCDAPEDEPSDVGSMSSNYDSPRHPNNHDDNDDTDDGDADDDTQPLSPCQREIGVVEIEGPFCSLTKMLLSVAACVIFAAAVAIALVIPLIHNSGNTDGGTCPPIQKPKHGTVKCENETANIATKCQFKCDDNFKIDGRDTIVCNGGRWSTKEPTCEMACELPKIANAIVNCTNQSFVHSTCSISCENHHVIQGKSIITCKGNGSWSAPVPSCVCPKCSVGDNCEYSISWQSVVNNLAAMQPYGTIPVNYGGKIFVCSTELHSIRIYWTGKCVDKGTGTMSKCSTDHNSPPGAADAAAANLIRRLVDRKIFPEPCDANKMPTSC